MHTCIHFGGESLVLCFEMQILLYEKKLNCLYGRPPLIVCNCGHLIIVCHICYEYISKVTNLKEVSLHFRNFNLGMRFNTSTLNDKLLFLYIRIRG